jgi:hypothetical protein
VALEAQQAFCIVPADHVDLGELQAAVAILANAGGRCRLCLFGKDVALLQHLDLRGDARSVGFALEVVDTTASFADLMWDRLEAVKFDPGFVARAERNIRTGLALGGMLDLARQVGMCTLGTPTTAAVGDMTTRFAFDYLPLAKRDEPPVRATLSPSVIEGRLQSTSARNFFGSGTDLSSR